MTPHTHYPTLPQTARLLNAVADHVTRRSLDGRVYRFQNQAVEIVRRTQTELVIATLDRAQTLRYRTGMVCMMTVPLTALACKGIGNAVPPKGMEKIYRTLIG